MERLRELQFPYNGPEKFISTCTYGDEVIDIHCRGQNILVKCSGRVACYESLGLVGSWGYALEVHHEDRPICLIGNFPIFTVRKA